METAAPPDPGAQTREKARPTDHRLADDPRLFMALAFIIVVVIALLCPDKLTAFALMGVVAAGAALFWLYRGNRAKPNFLEGYANYPGVTAPYAAVVPPAASAVTDAQADTVYHSGADGPEYAGRVEATHYPGAIDVDEYETEAEYGHRDRKTSDNPDEAYGNPYVRGRIAVPTAAAADIDDEANDAEMDIDELNTYQSTSRNDAERVTAGTMNRRRDLDKYLREEVEEAEDRYWWGRHEL